MNASRVVAAAIVLLSLPSWTMAIPSFARAYKNDVGYMPSCNACHVDGGGSKLTAYGEDFKRAGKNKAAFSKISRNDSDKDGSNNRVEMSAKSNPGDKKSTPQLPGDWLSTSSLIPREIRQVFPGVLTWLPKDALLTASDIEAAKRLGVALSNDDDNTIYIPLIDRRPAGTGLIFSAHYQGKDFFLLMRTDRQLTITQVSVLHADQVPSAKGLPLYRQFIGQPVNNIVAKATSPLEESIVKAVKRASILLYVRLKGA